MTEHEWLACDEPSEMYSVIRRKSDRKLLLLCLNCCFLKHCEGKPATSTHQYADLWRLTERFADGEVEDAELRDAWNQASTARQEQTWPLRPKEWARTWLTSYDGWLSPKDLQPVACLVREMFGNPFRRVRRKQSWLTTDVLLLAKGIYKERAYDRMPILADALQDAGCENEDVISHCRNPKQIHVRGCWVLDMLLGRS